VIAQQGHQAEETRDVNTLNAQAIASLLIDLIELDDQPWSDDGDKPQVRSFAEAGVMTMNVGLVLRAPDGQEFQITVVRSR
jgi:hypothetical protein